MQDGFVIAYESCKLKDHEKNYATHDLELVAIVHTLKMYLRNLPWTLDSSDGWSFW